MMGGWKTWAAAIGLIVLGLIMIALGLFAASLKEVLFGLGVQAILFGFGLIGIGCKVEKNTFPQAAVELLKTISEKQAHPPIILNPSGPVVEKILPMLREDSPQNDVVKPEKPAPDSGYITGF